MFSGGEMAKKVAKITGENCWITTEREYTCKGTITVICETLDEHEFFMPNRSCIINMSMVKSFKK